MKRAAALLLLLLAALLLMLVGRGLLPPPSPPPSAPGPSPLNSLSAGGSAKEDQLNSAPFPLNSPATTIAADLQLLAATLETFRTNFPSSGNPVGENAEITAALTGRNPLHLVLIPPRHLAINARGELCDRWGTPFFFHQLSGTQMEIRSAGPDRHLHTADDLVLTP